MLAKNHEREIQTMGLRVRMLDLQEQAITDKTIEAENKRHDIRLARLKLEAQIAIKTAEFEKASSEEINVIKREFKQKEEDLERSHLKTVQDLRVDAHRKEIAQMQDVFSWRKFFTDASIALIDTFLCLQG